MKRVFAVLMAATCVVASTPSFARGGGGHGGMGRGGFRNQGLLLGPSPQVSPTFQSRIPSPLPAPSQAPVINGPSGRSPYGGVF
jgi:hypothetical protein